MWFNEPTECVFDPHRNQRPSQLGSPPSRAFSHGFGFGSPPAYPRDHWTALGPPAAARTPLIADDSSSLPSSLGNSEGTTGGSLDYDSPPPDYSEQLYRSQGFPYQQTSRVPGFDPPNWDAFMYGPYGYRGANGPWGHHGAMPSKGVAPHLGMDRHRRPASNQKRGHAPSRIIPAQSHAPPPPHYGTRLHPGSFSHIYPREKSLPRTPFVPDPIYESLPLHKKKIRKPYVEIALTIILLIFALAVGVAIAVVGLHRDDQPEETGIEEIDVRVSLHIDMDYTDAYNDSTSDEFKNLESGLCNQSVEALGQSLAKTCSLVSARPGSVIAKLLYRLLVTPELRKTLATGNGKGNGVSDLAKQLKDVVKTNLMANRGKGGLLSRAVACDDDCSDVAGQGSTTVAPVKPVETTAAPVKPAETTAAPVKPAETTAAPAKPAETTAASAKPAETTPAPAKPAETTPAPAKPAETTPAPAKPVETTAAPVKPAETTAAPAKPAETTAAPVKPDPTTELPRKEETTQQPIYCPPPYKLCPDGKCWIPNCRKATGKRPHSLA